ncbi:uncharacterized protein B0J16DRAFT_346321 [Fusarium flagelliforme]|uniref:uncharacterized protein n=1 Tax=Fusarium flagelliforme TaxID=2675880 RepID=UPI001E8D3C13|nr:uncharacterized protein B0J16DRAFT_346321 [Fusarium flagelliforme]KAH7179128.1 hypothetical protein B0J16DRAFT_346321 [Fusarium flagelliforme]
MKGIRLWNRIHIGACPVLTLCVHCDCQCCVNCRKLVLLLARAFQQDETRNGRCCGIIFFVVTRDKVGTCGRLD